MALKETLKNAFHTGTMGKVCIVTVQIVSCVVAYIIFKDATAKFVGGIVGRDDPVLCAVTNEISAIDTRIGFHNSRMQGCSIGYMLKQERGDYPYLFAKKDGETSWRKINECISNLTDQVRWIDSYKGNDFANDEKAQKRYAAFAGSRQEFFERYKRFLMANIALAEQVRRVFALRYVFAPTTSNAVKDSVLSVCQVQFGQEESSLKALEKLIELERKEESEYIAFAQKFKWQFDKF